MISKFSFSAVVLAAVFCLAAPADSHPADENPALSLPENAREFRQDRFGLFLRWGLYSQLAEGENVMKDRDIRARDYERLAQFFQPAADFSVKQWVATVKGAGIRYIVMSVKARDGFALWNARSSDWNVVKRTPYGKDLLQELLHECRHQGVKLHLYYSPVDWHYAELFQPQENPDVVIPETPAGDKVPSVAHTKTQLTELLTRYGPINGIRLDAWDASPEADGQLQEFYRHIHNLQSNTLIGTNHGREVLNDESYQIRLGNLPVPTETDPEAEQDYRKVPLEISDTINDSSSFNLKDNEYKSAREILHNLVRAAGSDANYLLNLGVMPNGKLQSEYLERLRTVGLWLAKHGDGIFDTRGGPTAPQPWGVTTHRGRRIFVHVLDAETTSVQIKLPSKFRTARYLTDESDVRFETTSDTLTLNLRKERRGELERVVVLETQEYREQPRPLPRAPLD